MTEQQAKEIIEEVKVMDDNLTQYIHGFDGALEMSMSALEKQIAKKPKWNYEKVQKHMNKGVKAPYCPICGCDLLDDANDCYNYCTNCGQKLDWSDYK